MTGEKGNERNGELGKFPLGRMPREYVRRDKQTMVSLSMSFSEEEVVQLRALAVESGYRSPQEFIRSLVRGLGVVPSRVPKFEALVKPADSIKPVQEKHWVEDE